MNLLCSISQLQQEAIEIPPPSGTDRLSARGGLAGPAFFPEGFGLPFSALRNDAIPEIMAIGHNFGCANYREEISAAGREDDKATWRNLDILLRQAGTQPENCFRTNWFVGLLPGSKQTGRFLRRSDPVYEFACNRLLVGQIKYIQPKTILFLGPEVARRAYQLMPALVAWKSARNWAEIDASLIGHSPRNVEVPAACLRTNVAALLHPSFGMANEGRRMMNMLKPVSEVEIIRAALRA